ncbi:MAG TPA: hypothetical protein VMH87_07805 [Pseudomonadales bacterium]|nr:hypothetical protein [Pseudomonadales bacterium]
MKFMERVAATIFKIFSGSGEKSAIVPFVSRCFVSRHVSRQWSHSTGGSYPSSSHDMVAAGPCASLFRAKLLSNEQAYFHKQFPQ